VDSLSEIVDLLAVYGVHEGFPRERQELGGKLMTLGVSCSDLELLHRSVSRSTAASDTVRVFASVVCGTDKLMDRIVDLRGCAEVRKQHTYPGAAQWVKPEPVETQWARLANRRIAYGMVVADRKSVAVAAKEMGISEAEVLDLIAVEKAERAKEKPAPKKKPEPTDKWGTMSWNEKVNTVKQHFGGKP
jgi:hypothetical protein